MKKGAAAFGAKRSAKHNKPEFGSGRHAAQIWHSRKPEAYKNILKSSILKPKAGVPLNLRRSTSNTRLPMQHANLHCPYKSWHSTHQSCFLLQSTNLQRQWAPCLCIIRPLHKAPSHFSAVLSAHFQTACLPEDAASAWRPQNAGWECFPAYKDHCPK